jgi:hypothetical protein
VLCVLLIGFQMSMQSLQILVVVVSMALGGLAGELLNIAGDWIAWADRWTQKLAEQGKQAEHSTSLICCAGAMAIVDSIEDGINNNHEILYQGCP